MTVTLLAFSLLATIDTSHYAGALTDEAPDLSNVPVSHLTHEQLLAEQARLEPTRTAFIAPVVLTSVGGAALIIGGVVAVAGVVIFLAAHNAAASTAASVFAVVGIVMGGVGVVAAIAGGVLLTIGLVRLFPALALRRENAERRDEIQKRLEQLERRDTAPPPAQQPPSPGDAAWRGPDARVLVATF